MDSLSKKVKRVSVKFTGEKKMHGNFVGEIHLFTQMCLKLFRSLPSLEYKFLNRVLAATSLKIILHAH